MTIFALDSAGKTAGVCLWQNGQLLYESYLCAGHTHSETLLSLCDGAFRATQLSPADITLFAVNAGPGSFTGLRIGLAAVKGLAFPANALCAPVSTLEALVYSAVPDGLYGCALDARRSEVYCAVFRRCGGTVTRLAPDSTLPASAFAENLRQYGEPVWCMGDGAHLVADNLSLLPYAQPYRLGRALGVALAGEALLAQNACVPAAQLTPEYHRLSQAERERQNK